MKPARKSEDTYKKSEKDGTMANVQKIKVKATRLAATLAWMVLCLQTALAFLGTIDDKGSSC